MVLNQTNTHGAKSKTDAKKTYQIISGLFASLILLNLLLFSIYQFTDLFQKSPTIPRYYTAVISFLCLFILLITLSQSLFYKELFSSIGALSIPTFMAYFYENSLMISVLCLASIYLIYLILNPKNVLAFIKRAAVVYILLYSLRYFKLIPPASVVEDAYLYFLLGSVAYSLLLIAGVMLFMMKNAVSQLTLSKTSLQTANKQLTTAEIALIKEKDLLEERVIDRTQELETALKHKDVFFATMSHELRTPLNAILSRTQAANMGVYGSMDAKFSALILGIEASGQHLLSLINEVLDFSKIEAGAMEMRFEQVDLTAVFLQLETTILSLAQQKNLSFELDTNHSLDYIEADVKRLRQIFLNLFSNAIKFTPEGKRIGMRTDQDRKAQTITFTIWDEGIGISPENQKKLFQPFSQIDNKLSRQYDGTGLGLSIVQKLVDLHHGTLRLISIPEVGSQFIITLPLNQPAKSEIAEESIHSFQ